MDAQRFLLQLFQVVFYEWTAVVGGDPNGVGVTLGLCVAFSPRETGLITACHLFHELINPSLVKAYIPTVLTPAERTKSVTNSELSHRCR